MNRTRSTFWADVRRDYAALRPQIRDGWHQAREQWRELAAEFRQDRQLRRRIAQRITGLDNPARRQFRRALKAISAEADELKAIERTVLREHRKGR